MSKIAQSPPLLLARATSLRLSGRVHFPRDCIGTLEHCEDEDFEIFRRVLLDPAEDQPERPGALFAVRFSFARRDPWISVHCSQSGSWRSTRGLWYSFSGTDAHSVDYRLVNELSGRSRIRARPRADWGSDGCLSGVSRP